MKKIFILFAVILFSSLGVLADEVEIVDVSNVNMQNFWEKNGKNEQKITEIGTKILYTNKIDKRVAFQSNRNRKIINATTSLTNKTVTVYYGLLPYIDNDDELAYIMSHEIAHALDAYGGILKWTNMTLNSKSYETKADLIGIDLMVKAGYNPIAAITCANKWMPESYWDTSIFTSHPKTSTRLMNMYKYIYVKYPWALTSEMTNNINYQNFKNSSSKEISEFIQHEKDHKNNSVKEDL